MTGWRWVALAALITTVSCHATTDIERSMLTAARDGQFPLPEGVQAGYTGGITCRVDDPGGFEGADIYLCALDLSNGAREWEWGALLDGALHTHATDPKRIPTITGPWDPPWQP